MKRLIADSGSTKTDWVKTSDDTHSNGQSEIHTGLGLNPRLLQSSEIEAELKKVCERLGSDFDEILFFGAGVGNEEMAKKIENCIHGIFNCSGITVKSDIVGAAMALLGDSPGIACIMGTGSNSCHYDGIGIDHKPCSLGYIIDDNGGGTAFGRRILFDVYKDIAPKEIRDAFFSHYDLTVDDVVSHLYKLPSPNRWIAGFMPFIVRYKNHPYVADLVDSQLNYFLDREFFTYSERELREEGIGFVGSVAYYLSDEIKTHLKLRGWKLRDILQKPLDKFL